MTRSDALLIRNASVLTMDPDRPRAEAVYVEGGTIVAVGSEAEVVAKVRPGARVLDAGGATVLPGLTESHMHLFSGAAELDHLHLDGVEGFAALQSLVAAYAAERPDEPLLFGQGASYTILGAERLDRHLLDRILPDRPLAIFAHDHHTVWANTPALAIAGLIDGRQVRPGNEVVMGADGRATGELREMEAFAPLLEVTGYSRYRLGLATGGEPDPYPTGADWERDIAVMRRGLAYCVAHGYTAIQCMDGNLYQLELLAEIERRDGQLPCRVRVPFHFKSFMQTSMLEKASAMAASYASASLSSGIVKMFHDGVLDSWTAVMVEPYANRPDTRGRSLFTREHFTAAVVEADRRGLQVAVHAIGDGAVRAVLDAFEEAQRVNGRRDSRHRIEHVEMVHPDDVPRFAELGVIASMQPIHAPGTSSLPLEPTASNIGRARWPYAYAWRTLRDAGARMPFASDWPVASIDPMVGVQAALMRKLWAEDMPDQRLTLHEALASYTIEGAHAGFADDRRGSLRCGSFADLTILDADIESRDPAMLDRVKPAWVICDGRITFTSAEKQLEAH